MKQVGVGTSARGSGCRGVGGVMMKQAGIATSRGVVGWSVEVEVHVDEAV